MIITILLRMIEFEFTTSRFAKKLFFLKFTTCIFHTIIFIMKSSHSQTIQISEVANLSFWSIVNLHNKYVELILYQQYHVLNFTYIVVFSFCCSNQDYHFSFLFWYDCIIFCITSFLWNIILNFVIITKF